MAAVLYAAAGLKAVQLTAAEVPVLQVFFEANPLYFLSVNGEPAKANEAHEEFHESLPPGLTYKSKVLHGYYDIDGNLQGMANVVEDLMAPNVWHIGTFIVATERHGKGDAQQLYSALERWIVTQGAQWLRLGVVADNARAERFWSRCGYTEVRQRPNLKMGQRLNTVRVMLKPLAGGTVDQYLALVPRDRPDA